MPEYKLIKEEGRKSPNQEVYSDFCLHSIKRTIMAASKAYHHVRSISLPSTTHPIANWFEENLCRLGSSQTASTSSSSVSHNLSILGDLYTCVDELLHLPINLDSLLSTLNSQKNKISINMMNVDSLIMEHWNSRSWRNRRTCWMEEEGGTEF